LALAKRAKISATVAGFSGRRVRFAVFLGAFKAPAFGVRGISGAAVAGFLTAAGFAAVARDPVAGTFAHMSVLLLVRLAIEAL
jgi:hypothetical protein